MAYQRGSNWYVDVTPRGYTQRIVKSTGQGEQAVALAYEAMLRKLAHGGRHDLLDAVAGGRLHVATLYAYDAQGRLHELQLGDRLLRDAVAEFGALDTAKRHRAAMTRLLDVAPASAMTSWLGVPRNLRSVIAAIRGEGLAGGTEYKLMSGIGKLVSMELGPDVRRAVFRELDIRRPGVRDRWLTLDEILRLEQHAGDWWPVIALSLATGIRRGELLRLERTDVDYEAGQLIVQTGKTERATRRVPVPDEVLALLRAATGTGRGRRLFPGVTLKRLRNAWTRIRTAAELEDVVWHDLRRTFGVSCARSGVPIGELQQYMGHANVNVTLKHYGRYVPEQHRPELARAMAALGFGSRTQAGLRVAL